MGYIGDRCDPLQRRATLQNGLDDPNKRALQNSITTRLRKSPLFSPEKTLFHQADWLRLKVGGQSFANAVGNVGRGMRT